MDYTQHTLAELKPKFKGLLTTLLSEAFYEEEAYEPLDLVEDTAESKIKIQLGSYMKPFT